MLKFTTRGAPEARGRQQAAACGDLARPWFRDMIEAVRKQTAPAAAAREVAAWRNRLKRAYPEGYAECCGIAAGMGLSEDDYFCAAASFRLLKRPASCTAAGFVAGDGRPLFAKSDDIRRSELGMNVLETTFPDRGHRHVHFHFADTIWTVAGMNEHGLAMGMTGIPGPSLEGDGLFSLDALHSILPACATVEEAVEHIRALPLNCCGFSLTLADAGGRLAQVEKSGAGFVSLPLLPGGAHLHANTILDPAFAAQNPPQSEALAANSDRRMKNAERLLAALPRTEDGLRRLMNDRSPEGSIRQSGEATMFTDFWALFSAAEKRFDYCAGWPDYSESGTARMADLFGPERPSAQQGGAA